VERAGRRLTASSVARTAASVSGPSRTRAPPPSLDARDCGRPRLDYPLPAIVLGLLLSKGLQPANSSACRSASGPEECFRLELGHEHLLQ
jgi:hypothetical protein